MDFPAGDPVSETGIVQPPDATYKLWRVKQPVRLAHTTRVGDFKRSTTLSLVMVGEKDKAVWRIAWSPTAILPKLSAGRLVRMTRIATSRGRIIAREGTELATFIDGAMVGVVPGQHGRDVRGVAARSVGVDQAEQVVDEQAGVVGRARVARG